MDIKEINKLGFKDIDELVTTACWAKAAGESYDKEVKWERDLLKTLRFIVNKNNENPEDLKKDLKDFIVFWGESCDDTDGEKLDYNGQQEQEFIKKFLKEKNYDKESNN